MSDLDAKLDEALRLYLEEYGPDGYDRESFIDFVAVAVLKPGMAGDMQRFYEKRVAFYRELFEGIPVPTSDGASRKRSPRRRSR
jgi:hypothetical protein